MKKIIFILFIISEFLLAQPQPYVVLVSFDAFRWDYSERAITPNLQKLKDSGVTAKTLQPCFPSKTFPNHYSIVTGMYPENHGIISNNMYNKKNGESYSLGNREAVQNPDWYKGVAFWELAEANNIRCASFYWPGSEVTDKKRRPTYWNAYDMDFPNVNRIDTVVHWLSMPYSVRPHFITIYFHETDSYGHDFGPNSPEINSAISRLDSLLGLLTDGLKTIGMKDSVNLIVLSDHGMTEVYPEKIIGIEKLLHESAYDHIDNGPFLMIDPKESDRAQVYNELKKREKHFRCYTKSNIPDYFHFSHNDLIYSIILIADPGWNLLWDDNDPGWYSTEKGNHGYDNYFLDMHGTFIAAGPNFKQNYQTGTVQNIDIFPLLANIFNLKYVHRIDGKLDRIKHILKEK